MSLPECRLASCRYPQACEATQCCLSTAQQAQDYRWFLEKDAMGSLRHILTMIDEDKPIAHIRIEVQTLLIRMARTI